MTPQFTKALGRYFGLCYIANSVHFKPMDSAINHLINFRMDRFLESLSNAEEKFESIQLNRHNYGSYGFGYVKTKQIGYLSSLMNSLQITRIRYSNSRIVFYVYDLMRFDGSEWGTGNNAGDQFLFRLAKNFSREERDAPEGFRIAISGSLEDFFSRKSPFDPTSSLIYADHLEEQGEIGRANKLRKYSKDLSKFAGKEGMRYLDRKPTPEIWKSMIRNFSVYRGRKDLANRIEKELRKPLFLSKIDRPG